ncbi:helix-turn-helix domain-containing protein [Streptomyces pseudovenezuelae]|uniref:Transcriptional regulator with XRE-family HTH domain/tetratricopeptide (TPR) repeat protein n=1 Tax=Streptomyces pseudovenezuelae TaxID=67350 RepID=A0ABT6LJZ4_9ACTN|nr:helix-turn-helix transcriptional regulator [Streptomyces pseudovenezuelae]MDH6216615.1 transcriptional regulator with XRE-family HTH domain/tetratricopeptide (TPR) repeat protein [Streptomyces pseudovenezuelae]
MIIEHDGFGADLRRRRIAAGLSLSELAGKVYCSRSFLSRVENGRRRASPELAQLCDEVLGAKGALVGLVPPAGSETVLKAVRKPPDERTIGLVKSSGKDARSARAQERAEFRRLLRRGDLSHAAGEMREADRHYTAAYRAAAGDPRAQGEAVIRMARRWSDPGQVDRELLQSIKGCLAALQGDESIEAAGLRLRLQAHLAKKMSMAVSQDTAAGLAGPGEGARLAEDTLRRLPTLLGGDASRQLPGDGGGGGSSSGSGDGDRAYEVHCEVLIECRWARYDFMPAPEALTLSEQLRDAAARHDSPYFRGEALMALAIDQLRNGKIFSALATANQYRKHAADTHSTLVVWQQRTLDALLDLWHGRFDAAADWIFRESLEFVELLSADFAAPADNLRQTRLGQAYWLLRQQGRLVELFTSDLAGDVERHAYFPIWRAGLALALCETGQYAEGADLFLGCAAEADLFPPSGWTVSTLVILAEVCAALDLQGGFEGELAQVVPALRAHLAPHDGEQIALAGWPTVLLGPTARACGLLALAAGEPETALDHFRQAEIPARSSQPELARLRLARARALRRAAGPGSEQHSDRLLREALRGAEAYGMTWFGGQCRALLDDPGRS